MTGTCIYDHSVCSEVWGSCRSILTSLSIVDVIQAGVDRIFFFFFLVTTWSWERKCFHSQFAIRGSKAKMQQEREERLLFVFELLCLGSKNPRSFCAKVWYFIFVRFNSFFSINIPPLLFFFLTSRSSG